MLATLTNGALFQLVWLACVGGGASGRWWLGPAAALAFALWQVPRSPDPRAELRLMGLAVAAGLAVDSTPLLLGLVRFPHPGPWTAVAPVWILALWAAFALTLNHSLIWLRGRPWLAAAAAALFAPLSYWGGASVWGAVELVAPAPAVLTVLAALWALTLPALLAAAGRPLERSPAPVRLGWSRAQAPDPPRRSSTPR